LTPNRISLYYTSLFTYNIQESLKVKNRFLLIGTPLIIIVILAGFIALNAYNSPLDTTGVQYVTAETFAQWYSQGKALVVDVQTYGGYTQMHFPGSLPTHAYPVRTPDQKKRVESVIPAIKKTRKPVVLVCPGGITGAPNARLHLLSKGIPNERLFVLQGGTAGFPWKNMLISGTHR
jgi:thiosulfate/3-mercaptopyruvate sulfurtransferase